MQKIIFLLTALLLQGYYILEAQQKYFERTYLVQDISDARNFFLNQDGSYTVIGNSMSVPNLIGAPFYMRLNEFGDTLSLKKYMYTNRNTTIWDAVETQNGYALAICQPQTDTSVGCNAHLMRLSYTGELLNLSLAGSDTIYQSWGRSILHTLDNGYIMAGLIIPDTSSHNKLYIVKLNVDGSMDWEKIYDYFAYHNMFMDILPATDGGYYVLGTIGRWQIALPFGGWEYLGDILIYKIDDLGNVEWEEIYFVDEEFEAPISFCQFEDGQIFLAGARNLYNELIMKLDTSFNIVWSSFAGEDVGQPSYITPTLDGNILISGVSFVGGTNGYVSKVSPNGNILWKRIYGDAGHDYFYTHLILPDGSILIGGRNDMSSSAEVYVVKTNCMGLVTPLPQASFSWQANEPNPLAVQFNNFSQYVYADSIDGGKYIWEWGDGSPSTTFTSESFSEVFHYYPSPGTYTVTLTAIVCQDTSSIQATIETLSGAGGTVGLPPDIPPTDPLKGEKTMLVYPNPATNTLTFQQVSKSPSGDLGVNGAGDLEIKLHTLTGQTALQTTLAAGETVKTISVAHLPVGMYLYVAEQAGSVLARGKVAVVR